MSAQTTASGSATKNQTTPVTRLSYADVTASIFAKEVETKDGKKATFYDISLSRGYNDDQGERKYTSSLRQSDLLVASHALVRAYDWIVATGKAAAAKQ